MVRLAWRQLRARGARSVALALAILVASCGFTVLTAQSSASRLSTIGTVNAHATTLYDILVRPALVRSQVEQSQGLVQPGFLTGVYGGITLKAWQQIRDMSGVEVAAPIAMVGYAYPNLQIPINVSATWPKRGQAATRIDVVWRGDNGLTATTASPNFAYVTDQRLTFNSGGRVDQGFYYYIDRAGVRHGLCGQSLPVSQDPRPELATSLMECFSRRSGGDGDVSQNPSGKGLLGWWMTFPQSYVIAAVDPASENALVHLDSAVTSGRGLVGSSTDYPASIDGQGVPVLLADSTPVEESATVTLTRLEPRAATAIASGAFSQALTGFGGHVVGREVFTSQDAHQQLIREFRQTKPTEGLLDSRVLPGEVFKLGQVSLPALSAGDPSRVILSPAKPPSPAQLSNGVQYTAPDSDEPAARTITPSRKFSDGGNTTPTTVYLRGTFAPDRLAGLDDLTAQLLSGYATAPTQGADERSRRVLRGRPLAPSVSLAGLVQPPPLMITTLDALPQLETGGWEPNTSAAPISAIRVKVAGVTGIDARSRERVRLVAQRIQAMTGLDVDITVGSSVTPRTFSLPAGVHGRPALTLSQYWLKKGVGIAIVKAVDRKSVTLFVLVLLVSGLSVTNSAVASVRARRSELGVLACLGWRSRDLFRSVATELALIAGASGICAALVAVLIGAVIGTPVGVERALLAIPAALLVTVIAGVAPAWITARAQPLDAVRELSAEPKRAFEPSRVTALAWVNALRSPARTSLAALGLAIGIAAFTCLLGITFAFQGAVVGSILGDAVAIQARTSDYVAVVSILVLASLGVANVLILNIRERGSEIATLRALGWPQRSMDWLVIGEALAIGAIGATSGVGGGLVLARALTGVLTGSMVAAAAIAWVSAILVCSVTGGGAAQLVRRVRTTTLLAEA